MTDPVLRIDAHQHFWKYDPVRDAWITEEMKIIQRDFFPEDLAPVLSKHNIDGCVSVQADQSDAETHFLLELADKNDFIKGVVGWVDLRSEKLKEQLEFYSTLKKLKGFRHIVQAEPDGFLLAPEFSKGIALLTEFNFTYDILVYPHQLQDAIYFVRQHPDQSFVIDHLAKPFIKDKEIRTWARYMKEIALFPNVYCKLSGMVTEANWNNWHENDFTPYLDVTINCFGINRVMYGSDWPVCLVAASYEQQLNIVETFIKPFSREEKKMIMGENAVRFYNL